MTFTTLTPESRATWLELRKKYVTATDWPKIMGLSSFGMALDVLQDKLGYSQPTEVNREMVCGTLLEPLIRDWFADKMLQEHKHMAWETKGEKVYIKEDYHSASTPDGIFQFDDQVRRLVEIKTHGSVWEEIPERVGCQCFFQGATSDVTEGYVVDVQLFDREKDEIILNAAQGIPLALPREPVIRPFQLPAEALGAVMEDAFTWYEDAVIFGLPLVEQIPPAKLGKPKGKVDAPELVKAWKAAKNEQLAHEALAKSAEGTKKEIQKQLMDLFGDSAATATAGDEPVELTKAWVNGGMQIDHEGILKAAMARHPELKDEVKEIERSFVKFGAGYNRWSLVDTTKKASKKKAEPENEEVMA